MELGEGRGHSLGKMLVTAHRAVINAVLITPVQLVRKNTLKEFVSTGLGGVVKGKAGIELLLGGPHL